MFCRPGIAAVCLAGSIGLSSLLPLEGEVVPVPAKPVVGSSNPASPEPAVARPTTAPCTVTLFDDQRFGDYSAKAISYTPPSGCAGSWAKVVLTVDFTVTAGRQFDRTASIYLGNSNIYYGTTAEPRAALSPSWHVERDVTDLSSIFKMAQTGQAIVYNIVNDTYTGVIYGTAKLLFYPANAANPAPVVPQAVVPVSGQNSPYELDTADSELTATFTAPLNTERAYLDVISQSQSNDEFWYFCVPDALAGELETCGKTAFRETEVTIDGKLAGVAPVSPWIYTGGVDPYLWEPIPGIQTLNFKPYRVDLSPFAGVLSDGNPHTVGLSVFNANSYFLVTANLLLYTDPLVAQTGGGLEENTLTAPVPVVNTNLTKNWAGDTVGTVAVDSSRDFQIRGYVNTHAGREEVIVSQKIGFNSTQIFDVGANDLQQATQTSTVLAKTSRQTGALKTVEEKVFSFPLTFNYALTANTDGTYSQASIADQKYISSKTDTVQGSVADSTYELENVRSSDTLNLDASFSVTSAKPSLSTAIYTTGDGKGHCFTRQLEGKSRTVKTADDKIGLERVLTKVDDSSACVQP